MSIVRFSTRLEVQLGLAPLVSMSLSILSRPSWVYFDYGRKRKKKEKKKKGKKKMEETYFVGFSLPMRLSTFFDQVQLQSFSKFTLR